MSRSFYQKVGKNREMNHSIVEKRTEPSATDGKIVFKVKALRKIYGMGEVEVHALRGVDL